MTLTAFYQTVAQLCFTLLGLWWLVLQTKYHEWIGDPARRRMITNISLYFLLPGSMSLIALLSAQQHVLWQVTFFVASGIGTVETGVLVFEMRGRAANRMIWSAAALRWLGLAFYIGIALAATAAFIPGAALQLRIDPLTVSGVLLTLLVVSGVLLAWLYFIEPADINAAPKPLSQSDRRDG